MPITARTFQRPPPVPVETRVPFAFVHINKCGGSSVEIALGLPKAHLTAAQMRERLGPEDWDNRFTFAIVRNPFDRAVSIYYYRVRTDQAGLADRHLNVNDWVAAIWRDGDPAYLGDPFLTAPAVDWVTDRGVEIVDHIARLETLDRDWPAICDRLGIDKPLPVTNWNSRPPYADVLSAGSRAILEQAFAPDLERFGYAF